MPEGRPHILVDADACPVKDEAVRVAERHGLVVTFVSNGGLRPSRDPMVRHVVVSKGADAADDWIVDNAAAGDIVVTADVPLAARVVELGATALSPAGRMFTTSSIGMAVAMRDLKQHLREAGEIAGFNPQFSAKDRSAFLSALDRAVRRAGHLPAPGHGRPE
ncbi:MAG: YaiI/YqxD family protein [Rhizobiaceae bacterium]|nr:YaiI/YqxD family protein [Rhizobiaceae bacterium]MCV0406256.1 YaiI/YqxD family protein [Rhizobiaceae bacterium]